MKNFMGKEGFYWWQGVVEDRMDPLKIGRCRVRILGVHTDDKSSTGIPTKDLPWAMIMLPVNSEEKIVPPKDGTWVMGFFRDAENCQDPVIIGVIPGIPEEACPNTTLFGDDEKGFFDAGDNLDVRPIDMETIPSWPTNAFNLKEENWKSDYVGARSVARAVNAFLRIGMHVYFPTAHLDIQDRIDLIVKHPGHSGGWCVQIKTWERQKTIYYKHLEIDVQKSLERDDDTYYFVKGVWEFSEGTSVTWLPLLIHVGDMSYTNQEIQAPEAILVAYREMIKSTIETTQDTCSTLNARAQSKVWKI